MTNKYLEKIAASTGVVGAAGAVVSTVGRIAGKGVKALGNQVHLATGGGFRDHAMNSLGVDSALKLSRINGSQSGIKQLARTYQQTQGAGVDTKSLKTKTTQYLRNNVPNLKKEQNDARIIVGGTTAGIGYAAHKIKQKRDEQQALQSYNY